MHFFERGVFEVCRSSATLLNVEVTLLKEVQVEVIDNAQPYTALCVRLCVGTLSHFIT